MPGKRCSVAVCTNSFYKTRELSGEKHVGYFSFPKDPRLRKQWVEACKRKDVWNPENGHVCSVHFKEEDFERNLMAEMNFSRQKKILKPGSVPSLYLLPPKACSAKSPNTREFRQRRKENKAIVEEVLMFEEASAITREHLTEPCELVEETVEEKYANLLEDHTKLLEEFKALKLEHKACVEAHQREVDEREALVESRVKEVLSKIFTEGQISLLLSDKKQVKCWTSEEIGRAFSIRYLSKRCYIHLRNQMKFPLPGISTLQRWACNINMRQGLLTDVLEIMKVASLKMKSVDKCTVLQFDEMKVGEVYEMDKRADEVVGPHKQMMVVMARGLFSQWKQPVYVNFDTPMTKEILEQVLNSVALVGYTVVAVVCDNAGSNLGLWKQLGVSHEDSWFTHQNRKVYCFADAPHLLKLLRNHFIDSGFILKNNRLIDCEPVRELLKKTSTEVSSMFRLTAAHVTCEKHARQNVKLATQLMSHTTAVALRHYNVGEKEKTCDAADFIEMVNTWFDIFNSSVPFCNIKIKSAFGVDLECQLAALDQVQDCILHMRCPGKKSLLPFQKGILMSIRSLKLLYTDLKAAHDISFIMTRKLNQDSLENLFSQLRHRGGLNDHPSPMDALMRLRMIILGRNQGVVVRNSNSSYAHEEYLLEKVMRVSGLDTSKSRNNSKGSRDSSSALSSDSSATSDRSTSTVSEVTRDGLLYLAGWVAKKFSHNFPELGDKTFRLSTEHQYSMPSWITHLSYGGLTEPSQWWGEQVIAFEDLFRKYCKSKKIIKRSVTDRLFEKIHKDLEVPAEVLKALILQRVYIRVKYLNKQLLMEKAQRRKNKKNKKVTM